MYYEITIPLHVGQCVTFDDESYYIEDRCEVETDRFVVRDNEFKVEEKHMDWFYEMAEQSDEIKIKTVE